jgi:type VI protein secretion system component Hcp
MQYRERRAHGQQGPIQRAAGTGEASSGLAGTLQELQRTAGNRAVEAILEAGGSPGALAGALAVVPGVGTIPLESFQLEPTRPSVRDRERPKEDELPGGEMYFTSRQGAHSTLLSRLLIDGTPRDVEVIVTTGNGVLHLVLKGAVVSSYSVGSGGSDQALETWSLNFESMTQSIEGAANE